MLNNSLTTIILVCLFVFVLWFFSRDDKKIKSNVDKTIVKKDTDDSYQCHTTKKVVMRDNEYQSRHDCLEEKGTKSCFLGDAKLGTDSRSAFLEAENAVKTAQKDCEGLMPRRVIGVQEDCHYVSPYLLGQ